jgi:hypothetical protein
MAVALPHNTLQELGRLRAASVSGVGVCNLIHDDVTQSSGAFR